MSAIVQNLDKIRADIQRYSPHPERVQLVGVAKYQPVDRINQAVQAGLKIVANNYVQEGIKLKAHIENVSWHFVGHIQTNKVKELIGYDCIHTISRAEVAEKLNKRLGDKKMDVLLEVNIGKETSKSGVTETQLSELVTKVQSYSNLNLNGLMCLPPPLDPTEERRPFFKKLSKLASLHALTELSMGTSEDYRIALEEGATLIRLGSCLFGKRQPR